MTDTPENLDALADRVVEAFDARRQPDEFKQLTVVVDDDGDRETLIVTVQRADAAALADEVETFLRDQGAHTEREPQGEDDVSVLATLG